MGCFCGAAQDLHHALDLVFAANQGINLAVFGHLIEVLSELLQWGCFFTFLNRLFVFLSGRLLLLGAVWRVTLFDAVGDEIDHIQAGHTLLVQVVNGV